MVLGIRWYSVKRPRLKQRQKRVVSGRSCWWLDTVVGVDDTNEKWEMRKGLFGVKPASKSSGDGCLECLIAFRASFKAGRNCL